MKFLQIKPGLSLVLTVAISISLLGYWLRTQQFADFPPRTADELKNSFAGISLIKEGVPRSWSFYDEYGNFPLETIRGAEYRIVEPWFEEPPLYSLAIGAYAIYKGMDSFDKVDAGALRWPMIKLAALNIFLLFLLILFTRNFIEATLASLIFATEPTMVLSSRLALAENMITTSVLLSLILLVLYFKKEKRYLLWGAGLVSASAILLKTNGLFVPAAIVLLLLAKRRFRESVLVMSLAGAAMLGWFAYGYYYDWALFTSLLSSFSGRELFHPSPIINLFDTFNLSEKTLSTDAWLIWGWISVLAYSVLKLGGKDKLARLIIPVTVGTYLILFAVMTAHAKGHYRLPFYPFLSWASAAFLLEMLKNPRILYSVLFIGLPVASSYIYGNGENRWGDPERRLYQFFFPLLMLPSLLYTVMGNKTLKKIAMAVLIGAFALAIIFNVRVITFFQNQFWY